MAGGPACVVAEVDATNRETMELTEDKHNLHRAAGAGMEDACEAMLKGDTRRKACLPAIPPQPGSVTTRCWSRGNTTAASGPETPIGAVP